jgi:hypothetical protein
MGKVSSVDKLAEVTWPVAGMLEVRTLPVDKPDLVKPLPVDKPVDKPEDIPVDKPVDKPLEITLPVDKPEDIPVDKPEDIPVDKPKTCLPAPINKPVDIIFPLPILVAFIDM